MKVVTFNLRRDSADDGALRFLHRRDMILQKIKAELPDVIGFQEMKDGMQDWMEAQMPEYMFVGHGRAADLTNEAVPLAFRRDRYKMRAFECFWLSPTPQIPASKYEGQGYHSRTCCALTLYDMQKKISFRVLNVHTDNESAEVRKRSLEQVLEYCSRKQAEDPMPLILMGDFNAQPEDPEMEPFRTNPLYQDVTKSIPVSFHQFGNVSEKIDYIFVNDKVRCRHCDIWETPHEGMPLSDHYPVCAECELCL